ncbi:MAG TPA: hypothetical protein VGV07_11325 [Devosia sp.]|jgi:hypothetical protein|uniref:hypothetical protein n=1 Tax=Devosia sp. TaxID=1871048 RepID=UPI002DDD1C0A|nr:hypothetical protein [Devosia sp.]HEV2515833.1 hypothetical protein [Devosia sp.]
MTRTSATTDTSMHPGRPRRRLWIVLAVAAGVIGVLGANAHMVYVAFASQPDCVEHEKSPGHEGTYRAAKSAC